jgi:hypothetical protein
VRRSPAEKPLSAKHTEALTAGRVSAAPVPLRSSGLRREERPGVGERKEYVYKFFGKGEVQQKIDSRPEIDRREYHQIVVTFWVERAKGEGVLRLLCNGRPVQNWTELEKLLSDFRIRLIAEKHIRHAEVIIDQIGDAPLKVLDDILTVCFRARIKEVKMSSTEPQKEQ